MYKMFLERLVARVMSVQVVQEYERAVIFRLGRLVSGGAKGPGELLKTNFRPKPYVKTVQVLKLIENNFNFKIWYTKITL